MNTTYNRSDLLQGLMNTLQKMLEHALLDNWEKVDSYNTLRIELSGQLQPTESAQNPEEKLIIDELSRIDTEIVALAEKARDAAAGHMKNINGSKSKVDQYLQNQYN